MQQLVQITSSALWDACAERAAKMSSYPSDFWDEVLDYFSTIGWFEPEKNAPSYIVDNIEINGEILEIEDFKKEFPEFADLEGEELFEAISEEDYDYIDCDSGLYVVLNWGL